MSVLVFAGAAQFVAVPMIAAGTPLLAIIVTTYVVNMRHYLMAATLAPSFRGSTALARPHCPPHQRRVVRDRGGALASAGCRVYLGKRLAISGAFVGGVGVGVALGGLVERPSATAWTSRSAVFLALVAVQLRRRTDWLIAVSAAAFAVLLALVLPATAHRGRRPRGERARGARAAGEEP